MGVASLYLIALDIDEDYLIQVALNHIMEKFGIGPSIIVHGRGRQWRRPLVVGLWDDGLLHVLYSEPLHLHEDRVSNCRGRYEIGTIAEWNDDWRNRHFRDVIDDVAELADLIAQAEQNGAYIETIDNNMAEGLYRVRSGEPVG